MPLLKTPLISPVSLMLKLFNTPAPSRPGWPRTSDALDAASPETWEKLRLNSSGLTDGSFARPMVTVVLEAERKLPWPSKVIVPVPTAMPCCSPLPGSF